MSFQSLAAEKRPAEVVGQPESAMPKKLTAWEEEGHHPEFPGLWRGNGNPHGLGMADREVEDMAELRRQRWLVTLLVLVILSPIGIAACSRNPLPVPLPNQDIQLLCTDPPAFYHYDLSTGSWSEEHSLERLLDLLNPLPTEKGMVLGGKPIVIAETPSQTILWRDGEAFLVFDGKLDPAPVLPSGWLDPEKQALAFSLANTGIPGQFAFIDLASCGSAGCDWKQLVGLPVWSPDSSKMIVMQNTTLFGEPNVIDIQSLLSLGDGEGGALTPIGTGFNPFWLDNETYGYVRPAAPETSRREIVIASATTDEAQVLLTLEDLLETIPVDERPAQPSINYVAVNPSDAHLLGIMVVDFHHYETYVFLYERSEDPSQAGEVSLRLHLDGQAVFALDFSPDGHWLMVSSAEHEGDSDFWVLHLHDINKNQTKTFRSDVTHFERSGLIWTGYDWSRDGEWLIKINEGALDLIAPAHDYVQKIRHDFPSPRCQIVAWTNKSED
jgi:hypothetical protein